jgi:hypothetical protein
VRAFAIEPALFCAARQDRERSEGMTAASVSRCCSNALAVRVGRFQTLAVSLVSSGMSHEGSGSSIVGQSEWYLFSTYWYLQRVCRIAHVRQQCCAQTVVQCTRQSGSCRQGRSPLSTESHIKGMEYWGSCLLHHCRSGTGPDIGVDGTCTP